MPYNINFKPLPAGYAVSSAKRKDELCKIIVKEFVSSEDGDLFISRLEGFPDEIISKIQPANIIKRSNVDHIVAIIHSDGQCETYINELEIIALTRVRRSVEKGEMLLKTDLYDIQEIRFNQIEIPNDVGFVFVFSCGWRKGFFYDFSPLMQPPKPRSYDLYKQLGGYYNYLLFQELFKISDLEWNALFQVGWFPFIGLAHETTKQLIEYSRNKWDVDELLPIITNELVKNVQSMLEKWSKHPQLTPHFQFLEKAIDRYTNNDHISCTHIVYPTIERILRSIARDKGTVQYKKHSLSRAAMDSFDRGNHQFTKVFPNKFQIYLESFVFSNFDPENVDAVTRNTVAHGVAPGHLISAKTSAIGLLIIDQIYHHLPSE